MCAPTDVEEKLYVTDPFVNVSVGACNTPSTETITLPVGVAVLDVEPEATVIVIVSLAPNVVVLVAAATVVCEATCTGAATVTVIDVLEAAYVVSPEYVAAMVCEPVTVDEKLYVAEPMVSVSVDAGVPSTETATVPVGVVAIDVEPDATVIVIASVAPEAGAVLAATSVVLEVTSVALTTVTVTDPVDAAYVVSPEYVAEIVWDPITIEEKLKVAEPFTSASDEVCVVPSTTIVKVPVGVVVVELDPDATVMVIVSLAPDAGVDVAAARVVFEPTSDVVDPGQADNRLKKSIEPNPVASSYPVVAGYSDAPVVEQTVVPGTRH